MGAKERLKEFGIINCICGGFSGSILTQINASPGCKAALAAIQVIDFELPALIVAAAMLCVVGLQF
jgi:hypothetical protein